MTIHNLAYQGIFPPDKCRLLGLDWSLFSIDELEYYDQINLLKGGIIYADAITTVSPRTPGNPDPGVRLRPGRGAADPRRELHGILNGVDYQEWSPESDSLLPQIQPHGFQGKAANKRP